MLKLKTTQADGSPLYVLGLSHENLKRLKEDQPIKVNLADLGGTGEVLIFAGATEESMIRELAAAQLIPQEAVGPAIAASAKPTRQ